MSVPAERLRELLRANCKPLETPEGLFYDEQQVSKLKMPDSVCIMD